MYQTSTNILKKERTSTNYKGSYFIHLGIYNVEHEFYKKANCILRKEKYEGPKFKRTFVFKTN